MNIINFNGKMPVRKHPGDAGADCYSPKTYRIEPHETLSIPLGFGVELPENYVGFILPRSSMAATGVVAQSVPIDSNYRGELHAIITNYNDFGIIINKDARIAQLVIFPCLTPDFTWILPEEASKTDRGTGAFGSTGR